MIAKATNLIAVISCLTRVIFLFAMNCNDIIDKFKLWQIYGLFFMKTLKKFIFVSLMNFKLKKFGFKIYKMIIARIKKFI